jgi:cell division protein FtsL
MLRMFMFLAAGVTVASAFGLYVISYKTREMIASNQRMEKEIETLTQDIAILRAERSYLMRPERIEPLARKLGMAPAAGRQFMSASELQNHLQRQK